MINLKDIALPAFFSSLHAVRELIDGILNNILLPESNDISAAEREWSSGGLILVDRRKVEKQTSWSKPQAEAKAFRLLEEADQVSRARLLAAAHTESGLWLHTLPTLTLGTLLNSESLRIALALRVGVNVCDPYEPLWSENGCEGSLRAFLQVQCRATPNTQCPELYH